MWWYDKNHRMGREMGSWKALHLVYLTGEHPTWNILPRPLLSWSCFNGYRFQIFYLVTLSSINIYDSLRNILSISNRTHIWKVNTVFHGANSVRWASHKDSTGFLLVAMWSWRSYLTSLQALLFFYRRNQSDYNSSICLSKDNTSLQILPMKKKGHTIF